MTRKLAILYLVLVAGLTFRGAPVLAAEGDVLDFAPPITGGGDTSTLVNVDLTVASFLVATDAAASSALTFPSPITAAANPWVASDKYYRVTASGNLPLWGVRVTTDNTAGPEPIPFPTFGLRPPLINGSPDPSATLPAPLEPAGATKDLPRLFGGLIGADTSSVKLPPVGDIEAPLAPLPFTTVRPNKSALAAQVWRVTASVREAASGGAPATGFVADDATATFGSFRPIGGLVTAQNVGDIDVSDGTEIPASLRRWVFVGDKGDTTIFDADQTLADPDGDGQFVVVPFGLGLSAFNRIITGTASFEPTSTFLAAHPRISVETDGERRHTNPAVADLIFASRLRGAPPDVYAGEIFIELIDLGTP